MKTKKMYGIRILALAAIFFTAGCSADSTGNTEDGEVTIRMSWWGNDDRHKATLEAIEAFEEKNPKINVKAEYSGWDGTVEKVTTQIAGGTEPDLMQINYDWYQSFSPTGDGFYNLNELKNVISLEGYGEDVLEAGTFDGKLNGIPHGNNATLLALNKSTYEKFGVEIPSTWDGYVKAAEQFDEGYYPLAGGGFNLIVSYLTQKTGEGMIGEDGKVNYSKEELQEGLEWYQDLVDKKVIPPKTVLLETVGTAHTATVKEFIEGKFAGVYDWAGGLESYDTVLAESGQELIIPTFPTIENAENAGVIQKPTVLFSISKNSKHPEEAAKLLDFILNDPEGVKLMGTTRGVPVNTKAVEILEEDGQLNGISAEANEFVENTSGAIQSPFYAMASIVETYNTIHELYELGEMDAKEAASQIYDQVNAEVAELIEK